MIRSLTGRLSKKGHNTRTGSAQDGPWKWPGEAPLGRGTYALMAPSVEETQNPGRIHGLHPRGAIDCSLFLDLFSLLKALILQPALNTEYLNRAALNYWRSFTA